ncbi:hypothetical protein HZS55_15085 [Halosimplex rubrum]|uniref:Uncharacterized protein n=1 Tax=Halosimplex rubrum TaxID=869889 RepID=A0A7D5TMU0_9EURY|nr:hypothetical protein [Halosimplex rubrum]QLH78532.1 hypothetical protein HZS55_15085 [Halosimplex rubrum]
MYQCRRRTVLTGLASLVALSGCSFEESSPERPTRSQPNETTTRNRSPPKISSTTEKATQTPELSVREVLPEEGDDWTLLDTGDVVPAPLTAESHIRGDYRGPNGTDFRVIVIKLPRPGVANFNAERLACEAQWSVALQYRAFAIAASTGTTQKEFTPEHPPQMTQTAIPDTSAEARQLLQQSPVLSQEIIEDNEIDSC